MSPLLALCILLLLLEVVEMVTPHARWGDVLGVALAGAMLVLLLLPSL